MSKDAVARPNTQEGLPADLVEAADGGYRLVLCDQEFEAKMAKA
ncbi:MAG: AbrB/MazE/SpoVT family DNA-binding domain-containing protein [Acidiphilium sp.]